MAGGPKGPEGKELWIADANSDCMPLYDPKGDENEILHWFDLEQIEVIRLDVLEAMITPMKALYNEVLMGDGHLQNARTAPPFRCCFFRL